MSKLEQLISTVEENAVNNTATISNVSLWASSWRREDCLTDLERTIRFYASIGIEVKASDVNMHDKMHEDKKIELEANVSSKTKGYNCFVNTMYFNDKGEFLYQDIYE